MNFLNVSSIKEAQEKYNFQKEYCNSCAALDETNEAENYKTALNRVMKSIKDVCEDNSDEDGGNVLAVVHGGMIRLIIDYLDKSFNIRDMANSSISKIIYENGSFTVESVNDISYSEKGKAIKIATK